MRMRDLIDLVEAANGMPEQQQVDAVAVDNYGNKSGSGALAIAVFDKTSWPIFAITNRRDQTLYWLNRLPNGRFVDVHGSFAETVLRARFGDDITIKPVSRADALSMYQQDSAHRIPVRAAASVVNAVVTQAERGREPVFKRVSTPPGGAPTPASNARFQRPKMTRKGLV